MLFKTLTVAAAISGAMAQRPSDTPICDYYTTALLKNNTAANQKTVLTLLVNTVVIGNYTKPDIGITWPDVVVPGILAPGEFNGTKVNLAGYFNGGFASTNRGGATGESVNFLDDGGAAPLLKNMPAAGTTSNQYKLVNHLYEYFGTLLGCTQQGKDGFTAYDGSGSMYNTHKFMALSNAEVNYFITQVALAAASFGVAKEDITAVGAALASLFGMKCAPATVVIPTQPAALQAICIDEGCPTVAANATCASYAAVVEPAVANATLAGVTASSGSSSTATAATSGTAAASGTAATASHSGTTTHASSASGTAAGTAAASTTAAVTTNAGAVQQGSLMAAAGLLVALFL